MCYYRAVWHLPLLVLSLQVDITITDHQADTHPVDILHSAHPVLDSAAHLDLVSLVHPALVSVDQDSVDLDSVETVQDSVETVQDSVETMQDSQEAHHSEAAVLDSVELVEVCFIENFKKVSSVLLQIKKKAKKRLRKCHNK